MTPQAPLIKDENKKRMSRQISEQTNHPKKLLYLTDWQKHSRFNNEQEKCGPVSSSPQAAYYFRHFIRAVNAECNKHSIKRTHLTSIRMWNNMDPSTEVLTSWIL